MTVWKKIRVAVPLIIILGVGAFLRFYKLGPLLFWEDDPIHQVRMA